MASIDFLEPPDFPTARIDSLDHGFIDPWIDEKNIGVDVRRRVLSTIQSSFSYVVVCSELQRQNMLTFIKVTSEGGVLPFNWTDPRDDTVYECMFVNLPTFRHLSAIGADNSSIKEWECNITLRQTD